MSARRPEAELLYQSARTRVRRELDGPYGPVIRKELRGSAGWRRMQRELTVLRRLAGIDGVPRLVRDRVIDGSILMEDTGARSLAQSAGGQPMPPGEVIGLGRAVAAVLAEVHQRGVVHNDINPANLVVADDPSRPIVIDFDLATIGVEERSGFTHESDITGTLAYLSPEQTGRTGWPVDERTDLYSLGATLYELATGAPPFGSGEPLRLVHDQLTRRPADPATRAPGIPPGLSGIILRLLAKEPDRRYQSADGLRQDLLQLEGELAAGRDGVFPLGQRDYPRRLVPVARPVGRDAEIGELTAAFAAVTAGGGMTVLVEGEPGVGKTTLIDELRPAVAGARGWFVSGAFDEHRRDRRSGAVWQVLRGLCQLLLAMPESVLTGHRSRIRDHLGPNSGLLASILPELTPLLGVAAVDPDHTEAAENRLVRGAVDLLRAVASPAHPLVVVLDDLQWADPTTLGVVDTIVTDPPEALLLVGAYRESEAGPGELLHAQLTRWARLGLHPRVLQLGNLPEVDLRSMLGQMLRMTPEAVGTLAEAVGDRARGNPFDTIELVNALRRDGVLVPAGSGWRWDPDTVRRYVGRGDVVDLLADRIGRLPESSQQLLRVMAAVGGRVESELLEIASGHPPEELSDELEPALAGGLLVAESGGAPAVRFRHARVRQAALAIMEEGRRPALHLTVGRRLARHPELRPIAAEQYLQAIKIVTDPGERHLAAELFHTAAEAGRLTSPVMAERFLAAAAEVLIEVADLDPAAEAQLLVVERERYVALCRLGRFEEADTLFDAVLERSPDPTALSRVARSRINSLRARDRQSEALSFGLELLARMGLSTPAEADLPAEIQRGYAELVAWTADGGQAEDVRRPAPADQQLTAAAELINEILPVAFFAGHPSFPWLVLEARRRWAEHGPSPALVGPISQAGFVTITLRGDYRTGYEAARRVLAVAEARDYADEAALARFLFSLSAAPWFEPLTTVLERIREAIEYFTYHGRGNDAFAYYGVLPPLFDCGTTVDGFLAESEHALSVARRVGDVHSAGAYLGYRQLGLALLGETSQAGGLSDQEIDFERHLASLAASPVNAVHAHTAAALAAAIFQDPDGLIRHAETAAALTAFAQGAYLSAMVHLLHALALAERVAREDGTDQAATLTAFDQEREWVAARAADAPHSFGYQVRLLDAERAAMIGDRWRASAEYDAAIREVAPRQRPWHRALITERVGRFLDSHGLEHGGRSLLSQAHRHYAEWGATGKVEQMARAYPFLRNAVDDQQTSIGSSVSMSVSSDAIDMLAVVGAARALSSATSFDRLREQIADVLSAMTGAARVTLLMWDEGTQRWRLTERTGEPDLPASVIRYVQRTLEPLLVEDAVADDRFRDDPYLRRMASCSLLAVPIMSRGAPLALLLLEKPDSRGAFTADRLDNVLLVAGQLAVSIENAAIYSSLEAKVAQRTEALAAANARLEQLNQTDPLTGLANRRRLEESLVAEWSRGRTLRAPVGLAMVDIDLFKPFNDEYGHPAGDECLRQVARALAASARVGDLVARYGGEEFAVVLPGADLAAARQVGERLRLAVVDLRQPHRSSPLSFVTVSVGVASAWPAGRDSPDQLLAAADAALYSAKRGGRNQVGEGARVVPGSAQDQGAPSR